MSFATAPAKIRRRYRPMIDSNPTRNRFLGPIAASGAAMPCGDSYVACDAAGGVAFDAGVAARYVDAAGIRSDALTRPQTL